MDWAPYFKVNELSRLLVAIQSVIKLSAEWRTLEIHDSGVGKCFISDYIGQEFSGKDLALVLHSFDDEPGRLWFTMYAAEWGNEIRPPGGERAEHLAILLFLRVEKLLGYSLKLIRPIAKPHHPLRGILKKRLMLFLFF